MSRDAQIFEMFSLEELQKLVLPAALERAGVKDPETFLTQNRVTYKTAFRAGLGMSIIILKTEPIESEGE